MEEKTLRSTSRSSAEIDDIILRETNKTRLIFRPLIVENPSDKEACVKGWFIFQNKKPSGEWTDYESLSLSKLKDGEWVKLELKAAEVLKLLHEANKLQDIYKKFGIALGETKIYVSENNLGGLLNEIAQFPDKELLANIIHNLTPDTLGNLNAAIGVGMLKQSLNEWENNKDNDNELYWHSFFKVNPWIFSQIFSYSAVVLDDELYVGGKNINNKGGQIADFIYKNNLTKNTAIIEIKTPASDIVGSLYRGKENNKNAVYTINNDVIGAINQALSNKDLLQKNFYPLAESSENEFKVFNPRCIVVAGSIEREQLDEGRTRSFEMFRNGLKDVELITFDELFDKVKIFLDLINSK